MIGYVRRGHLRAGEGEAAAFGREELPEAEGGGGEGGAQGGGRGGEDQGAGVSGLQAVTYGHNMFVTTLDCRQSSDCIKPW